MPSLVFAAALVLSLIAGLYAAVAMGTSTLIYLVIDRGIDSIPYALIAQRLTYGINSFPLLSIPLFILMAIVMNESGLAARLYGFAGALVGHFRGGLAHVNVVASMIFAGMSGSSAADVAGLGRMEIAAMKREGYSERFSVAVTAASASVGPVIPPSIPAVLYAIWAGVSVTDVLLAGLIPGIVMGLVLMVHVAIVAVKGDLPRSPKAGIGGVLRELKTSGPVLLAPVILLGGLFSGQFTATESAAVAALYSIILAVVVYRTLSVKGLIKIFHMVAIESAKVMFLLAAASLVAWLVARARIPNMLAEQVLMISKEPALVLGIVVLFLLIVGMFLSLSVSVNILTPTLVPAMLAVGIDPIHFGVVMITTLVIGNCTPPFGMTLFILSDITRMKYTEVARACFPFLVTLLIAVLIIAAFPGLSTFLPEIVR